MATSGFVLVSSFDARGANEGPVVFRDCDRSADRFKGRYTADKIVDNVSRRGQTC